MAISINLFEFVNYSWATSEELKSIDDKLLFSDDLEKALDKIWAERKKFAVSENLYYQSNSKKQRFIEFKKNEIIPRNFIGTIQIRSNGQEYAINILPKVFFKKNHHYTTNDTDSIFAHILWWLSGSQKQNYFTMDSSLGALESNFLEILVYMFSNYTLEIYSSSSYNYYNTVNEELETVKGQIDFNKYVNNYAVGNRQKLSCVYDSLQYDNQFNRIVKYVCILLKDFTKNVDSKRNLEDILFILDEVDNIGVTAEDCDKVVLNSIYSEYRIILDNCKLFLTSLSIYKWKDDYSVFALLIPSEKLFENFIFTTFKRNSHEPIKNVSKTRPGRNYLVKKTPSEVPNKFKLINDFIIELIDNTHIIFDTKYKKLISKDVEEDDSFDTDYNVSQTDIYQMVSYAVASGISDIALIYPVLPFEKQTKELSIYEIEDSFTNGTIIRVHLFIVDIIHEDVLELNINEKLENIFESSNQRLINQLNQAVNKITSI